MARSNISKLKTMVSVLRRTTPPASAQTNVGNSIQVPFASMVIISAKAKQAANKANDSIVDDAVIRRILSGFSNISSFPRTSFSLCLVLYKDCSAASFSTSVGFGFTGVGFSPSF